MGTLTDLRKTVTVKRLLLLMSANMINDAISIMTFFKLNTSEITLSEINLLLGRYFCLDLGLTEYARFAAFYATVIYFIVDGLNGDWKKYGLFCFIRLGRKNYAFSKAASCVILPFFFCTVAVTQSFVCFSVSGIKIMTEQYVAVGIASFIITAVLSEAALAVFCFIKDASATFSATFAVMTALGLVLSRKLTAVPNYYCFDTVFVRLFVLFVALAAVGSVCLHNIDFISSKIKE